MQTIKYKIFCFVLASSLLSFSSADNRKDGDLETSFLFTGLVNTLIKTDEVLPNGISLPKMISLFKLTPSNNFINEKSNLVFNLENEIDYSNGIIPFNQIPGSVDLGMNKTPVLDQQKYGTCVTFAATAAIDAILGRGDFISQQCTLELIKLLGSNRWFGAYYPSEILDPLKKYGVIEKGNCNFNYANPSGIITIDEYQSLTDKSINMNNINYAYYKLLTLDALKAALNAKHRVSISVGLNATNDPISVQGFNVVIKNQAFNMATGGLWACKQPSSKTNYCSIPNAGHELVVIGYDDSQQLLKLRNSWNSGVGDNGDFYMTYTFFKIMAGDGTEIYEE